MTAPHLRFDPFTEPCPAGRTHTALDELREQHSVFRSTAGQGFWVLTRHDDILAALQNPQIFSSRSISVMDPDPAYQWIPIMMDPPTHTTWRRLLRPLFTPARAAAMQDRLTRQCAVLIDDLVDRQSCDFVADFARRYPTTIFLELIGLPTSQLEQFLTWEHAILHPTPGGPGNTEAKNDLRNCFTDLIAKRRARPRDDLVSAALSFTIDDRPVSDAEVLELCMLLFLAGMDTVAAQLSYAFWHLARHPADRARITAAPDLAPAAVEEFLRAHTLTLTARKLAADHTVDGCAMKEDDMVMLPLAMADRDPRAYPDPALVDFDRPLRRHLSFGAGPHRCPGAHLARLEIQTALREWHKRIPNYQISEDTQPMEHASLVLGIDTLPLRWK
ncbi:cytochrome P450 [Embleya sp. NPDC001921]